MCQIPSHFNVGFTKSNCIYTVQRIYIQGAESKYRIIIKTFFFSLINPIFGKKNAMDLNFHDLLYYSSTFFLLKFRTIWVRKKRNDKESMICLTPKTSQSSSVYIYKAKKISFDRKWAFLGKGGVEDQKKKIKRKEGFWTALATANKKDSATSIRKHANKSKVQEKTVRKAIKQDLSPDQIPLNTLYSAI